MILHKLATTQNLLEKAIQQAMKCQACTATELAEIVGMAPTNFSLARNLKRSIPLPTLLSLLNLTDFTDTEKYKVIEWIASNK